MNRETLNATGQAASAVLAPGYASVLDLTPADFEEGRRYLDETRSGVVDAAIGLSEAQWKFKPAPDRWSVAECVEHITLVEENILNHMREHLAASPAAPAGRDPKPVDELIRTVIPDRSTKAPSPPPFLPTGRWTLAKGLEQFVASRGQTAEFLQSTPALRKNMMDLPPLGQAVDGYQFVLALAAHSARHTKQILEIKADPGFPVN